jgi:acetyl esterase/lipase
MIKRLSAFLPVTMSIAALAMILGHVVMFGVVREADEAPKRPQSKGATGVRDLPDIPYVPGGGTKQQLDLYLPASSRFPTILYVHEGSLTSGDRKDADYPRIAEAFRVRGFGVAVMNYRLFPDVKWPAPAEDVVSAFAWLRQHIAECGGLPERIFLLGHSSGATLVARIAADARYLAAKGLKPKDIAGAVVMGTILIDEDFEQNLTRGPRERIVAAFTGKGFYAPYGDIESYRDSWPMRHVNADMPPILITVAKSEREQPPCLRYALEFQTAARKLNARVEVEVLSDRTHFSAMRRLAEPNDAGFIRKGGIHLTQVAAICIVPGPGDSSRMPAESHLGLVTELVSRPRTLARSDWFRFGALRRMTIPLLALGSAGSGCRSCAVGAHNRAQPQLTGATCVKWIPPLSVLCSFLKAAAKTGRVDSPSHPRMRHKSGDASRFFGSCTVCCQNSADHRGS